MQKKGLVEHTPYGDVRLTTKGRRVARQVKDRNDLIYRFLLDVLKLPPTTATRDACVLEHVVSPKTLERLSSFLRFTENHGEDVGRVIEQYAEWLKHEESAAERVDL